MAKNKTDNTKEKDKKPLWKKAFLGFVFIDVIVGLIFMICYLKGCTPFNKASSISSSSVVDTTDYHELDNRFKQIVKTQMEYDGFGSEEVDSVVAVTYMDNAPTSFDIRISATSMGYLYNLNIKGVQYKEGTDTLVSYLLCNNEIEGETNLYREQIKGYEYKNKGLYVISVPVSGVDEHKSGYELIDNAYHVSQIIEYTQNESGTISGMQTVIFEEGMPFYNYYRYLNNK